MEEVYSDEEMEEMDRRMEQIVNNVLEESVQPEADGHLGRDYVSMVSSAYYMCNIAPLRD